MKAFLTLITILSILACNKNTNSGSESEKGVAASMAVIQYDIYTQDCNFMHTITRNNAETYIYLDSLRTHHFEQKYVNIDGNMISLNHKKTNNYIDKFEFFFLLDSIQNIPDALLFVGYEVTEKTTNDKKNDFSNSCLNIYGATIENHQPKMIGSTSFYIGSGCDKDKYNVLKRDSIIHTKSSKYPEFDPKINKFGVVYNPKCLLKSLNQNFNGEKVYVDFAFNPHPANFDKPHQVFVFSDDPNLRSRAVNNSGLRNIKSPFDSIFINPKTLNLPLLPAYADNGQSCCPI